MKRRLRPAPGPLVATAIRGAITAAAAPAPFESSGIYAPLTMCYSKKTGPRARILRARAGEFPRGSPGATRRAGTTGALPR